MGTCGCIFEPVIMLAGDKADSVRVNITYDELLRKTERSYQKINLKRNYILGILIYTMCK